MKRPLLIETVAALTMVNTGSTGLASALPGPVQEAEQVIINQLPVDEEAIRQRGAAYTEAFLAAFRQFSGDYATAFRQGVTDGMQGDWHTVSGKVASVAYQRGQERGRQLARNRSQPVGTPEMAEPAADPAPYTDASSGDTEEFDQGTYGSMVPTNSQRAFINRLATVAQRVGQEYDLYPSVIIAQAALESDWGNSQLSRAPFHNLFGVKGYFEGQTTNQLTSEYTAGRKIMVVDNFRRYQDDYAALLDYAQTLQAPLYRNVHRQYASSYRQATHALQGRYATDPRYEQKLNQLIDGYQLTRYDHQPRRTSAGHGAPVRVTVNESSAIPSKPKNTNAHHHRRHRRFPAIISVAGGLGSAGLVELGRRLFLK